MALVLKDERATQMFNLSKLGVGEYFPYQGSIINKETGKVEWEPINPDSDEKVCFRQPDPDQMRAMRDKYKGKKINNPVKDPETRQMIIIHTYEQTSEEERAQNVEFWDKAIVDWTIKDETGKVIPLTAENKYTLVTMVPAFLRFCNRSMEILSGAMIENEKAAEKNS